jgi:paraquat-inducible protein A
LLTPSQGFLHLYQDEKVASDEGSVLMNEPQSSFWCRLCGNSNPITSEEMRCERCGHKESSAVPKSTKASLAFTLTAMVLYLPANLFPFMTIEMYGNRNSSTIWGGILSLADAGSMAIALIIFLASILIPFLKLIILFYLTLPWSSKHSPLFRTRLYQTVEAIGRWSMLDIFLLAVLVAIMKLGPWTTVRPEIGSVLFAFVVIFTMLASASFDPQSLWRNHHENTRSHA